jgi:ADP-heptose:LPS heptosyltransferase
MRAPAIDLVGKTTLGALTALIDGARLVVANDTGVRHVAAARGTPCIAVACGSDVRRWPHGARCSACCTPMCRVVRVCTCAAP